MAILTRKEQSIFDDGESGSRGVISGQNSSRFDEFRRNGRREVGNFAAQERNYGSPDETWLAIGAEPRRAPPILTERRGGLSFRRVVDDMRLPPTAWREDLIKALIGKWRDLIAPPPFRFLLVKSYDDNDDQLSTRNF